MVQRTLPRDTGRKFSKKLAWLRLLEFGDGKFKQRANSNSSILPQSINNTKPFCPKIYSPFAPNLGKKKLGKSKSYHICICTVQTNPPTRPESNRIGSDLNLSPDGEMGSEIGSHAPLSLIYAPPRNDGRSANRAAELHLIEPTTETVVVVVEDVVTGEFAHGVAGFQVAEAEDAHWRLISGGRGEVLVVVVVEGAEGEAVVGDGDKPGEARADVEEVFVDDVVVEAAGEGVADGSEE